MTAVPDIGRTLTEPMPGSPAAVLPERPTGGLPHACDRPTSADVSTSAAGSGARGRPRIRLTGIDAARGVALVGMMAVHTMSATSDDGSTSLAWTLAAGKAAALFAVLAGVGVALASGRSRVPAGRPWAAEAASLVVRAVIIGAAGLLIGYVVPSNYATVILPYYALLFVFVIPLLVLSSRALVALAVAIAVGMPVISHRMRAGTERPDVPNLTFADLAADPSTFVRDLSLTGVYPALPWLAYLCVGLAVGRALLTSRRTVATLTLVGVAVAVGARVVSWLLLDVFGGRARLEAVALQSMDRSYLDSVLSTGWRGTTPSDTAWWLATAAPHSSTPLDLAFTIGTSLAVLGSCILLGRATARGLRPLAAAGSMTLTLYCLHLLLLSWPPFPSGPTSLALQLLILVTFALLWLRYHARGPLEEIVAQATGAVRRRIRPGGRPATGTKPVAVGDVGARGAREGVSGN